MASVSMGGTPHAASQNRGPPPAEGSSAGLPYIGSTISLISKAEIRYEGTLYTIDTKESSISLQNVRSFGTEGRKTTPPQIPSSPDLYDFIIFRGVDIKELSVTEPSAPAPVPQPHVDPAIMSAGSKVPIGGSALPGAGLGSYPPSLYGGGFSSPWGPPPPASGSSPWAPGGMAPPPSAFTYPMQHPRQHQLGSQSHMQQPQQPQQQAVPSQKAPPQHVTNAGSPAQVVPAPSAPPEQPTPTKPQTAAQVVAGPPKMAPQQRPSGNPWGRGAPALAPPSGAQVPTTAPGAPNGSSPVVSAVSAAPSSYASAAAAVREGGVGRGGSGRGVMPGRGAPPGQGAGRGRRPPAALAEAVPQKARPVAPPTAAGAAASAAAATAMRLTRVIVPAEDFDFAANLEKFDKASLFKDTSAAGSVQVPEPAAPSKPLYEKDDFFDNMSCEALERLSLVEANKSNARAGKSFSEQRRIDKETFGASSYNRSRAGGRGRRGGGSAGSVGVGYSQHNQQGSGNTYSGDARDVGGRGGGGRRGYQGGRGGRGNGMRPMSTGQA